MRGHPDLDPALKTAIVLLLCALSTPLGAQTVHGSVVDSATSRPLAAVTAELIDSADRVIARATGDDSGRFTVTAPDSGEYRLQLQRIGYRKAVSGKLLLGNGGEMTVSVRLPAMPVALAPVKIEAMESPFLLQRGYYQRKESERGSFLDPGQVEKIAPKAKVSTDVLVHIPGVTIRQNLPHLRSCRTIGSPGSAHPFGAVIYVDGVDAGNEMMWSLQPNDILAVEVYMGPAQVPLAYGGTNAPCGVILVWTKH